MPGFVLHANAIVTCPHGVPAQIMPGSPRVKVNGQPVATMADMYLITGCPFTVGPNPMPCVQISWKAPATRVRVGGQSVVLKDSLGVCMSIQQSVNGLPKVDFTQTRVKGT